MTKLRFHNHFKTNQHSTPKHVAGFGMAEALVAASAGVLLISASTLALRSTGNLISKMQTKSELQQNTTSGKRLMRSEIERSLHLLIGTEGDPEDNLLHTDINHKDYQGSLNECKLLADQTGQIFNPIFGVRMAELNQPIYYGLSLSSNSRGYALQRCGSVMQSDGRYNESKSQSLAMVIDDIGIIRCDSDQPQCKVNALNEGASLAEIAAGASFHFSDDKTPERQSREPAIRIMTDRDRKLIRFIDPTTNSDMIETSFLKIETINKEITTQPFYFIAYARADKRDQLSQEDGDILDGLFFRNISSKRMRFLVDGSGSMSACILWGSGYGNQRIYWNGKYYVRSRRSCALTRMESLQHELIAILQELPNETEISVRSFSTPGYRNHRIWEDSSRSLVRIGHDGTRESAIAFVNTLDDGDPQRWGGTAPWEGLDEAFEDNNTDTLYFLSDGEPSHDRNFGRWTTADHASTASHYSSLNINREIDLKVNATSLGLKSKWMQLLAGKTTGDYLHIDKKYVMSASTQ